MSLGGAPHRLKGRLLGRGQPAATRDDPIARMIARTAGRINPARAYRWRLRGRLVNQYVAVREGLVPLSPSPRAGMGSLGRAVLFASVGLAVSVSAVGAASTSALPGDPLYAIKRQVEELRMEIAPPSVRPALAAMALEERLSEVEQLAAAGNWSRVALGEQEVDGAVATLRGLGASLTADLVADLTHHTQVLTGLMAQAPAAARPGLERAMLASAGVAAVSNPGTRSGLGSSSGASGSASNGNHGNSNNNGSSNNNGNSSNGAAIGGNPGGGKPGGGDAGTSATPSQSAGAESQPAHPRGSPSPHPSPRPPASEAPSSEPTQPAH